MSVSFQGLGLSEPLLRALISEGYSTPTPIQAKAIPPVLEGRDVMGCAQTGTGKTAAFALPILHRLAASPLPQGGRRRIRTLVLSPTRELASQIGESFRTYGRHTGLRHTIVFGGVGQNPQVAALRTGVDVLIATPGRLQDLMEQGHVDLRAVEVFVLDEADQMLDMGFIHAIRRIVPHLPPKRQNLMFSATMPREIRELANTILRNPEMVQVAPVSAAAETVEQAVYFVEKRHKPHLLQHLLDSHATGRTLVFARTKHGADKVAKHLVKSGIHAEAIHGNKSQNQRDRALAKFKSERPPVLVATDVAARGLDIDAVAHVINYDLPNVPETYVHRIGRTGRAGATGAAISFCDAEERTFLRDIEKLTRRAIPVRDDHPTYPAPTAGGEGRVAGGGHRSSAESQRRSGDGQRTPSDRRGGQHGQHAQHPLHRRNDHPQRHPAHPASRGASHVKHAPAKPAGHGGEGAQRDQNGGAPRQHRAGARGRGMRRARW